MALYGAQVIQNNNITLEEFCELQQNVIEIMSKQLCENTDIELAMESVVIEGANMEYYEAFKKCLKTFKECLKKSKNDCKSKDYKSAKAELKKCSKAVDEFEKIIKSTDSTIESAVFGWFASGLLTTVESLVPYTVSLGGSVFMNGSIRIINAALKGSGKISKAALFAVVV